MFLVHTATIREVALVSIDTRFAPDFQTGISIEARWGCMLGNGFKREQTQANAACWYGVWRVDGKCEHEQSQTEGCSLPTTLMCFLQTVSFTRNAWFNW